MNAQNRRKIGLADFYAQPAVLTAGGGYVSRFVRLPSEVWALGHIVQGLLLRQHLAPAYGLMLSDERISESHLRPVERMLDRLLIADAGPLCVARPLRK